MGFQRVLVKKSNRQLDSIFPFAQRLKKKIIPLSDIYLQDKLKLQLHGRAIEIDAGPDGIGLHAKCSISLICLSAKRN